MSHSGLYYDILVHWFPPASADVRAGWMSLKYELQYREMDTPLWQMVELTSSTQRSIYGLHTATEYEVRVRCKMVASENFGEFSKTIYVHVTQVSSEEPQFAMDVLLIFGTVIGGTILLLIIFIQHRRLIMLVLPPVPGPKIKGIDSVLLKTGKMGEVSSTLGSHQPYKADIFNEDQLMEFIDLDLDELDHTTGGLDPKHPSYQSQSNNVCEHDLAQDNCSGSQEPDTDPVTIHVKPVAPAISSCPDSNSLPFGEQCCKPGCVAMTIYSQVGGVTSLGGIMLSTGSTKQNEVKKAGLMVSGQMAGKGISADCCVEDHHPSVEVRDQLEGPLCSRISTPFQPSPSAYLPTPPMSGYTLL